MQNIFNQLRDLKTSMKGVPDTPKLAFDYAHGRRDMTIPTQNLYAKATSTLAQAGTRKAADSALLAFVLTKIINVDPELRSEFGIKDIYTDWKNFNNPRIQRLILRAIAMDDIWSSAWDFISPMLGPLAEPIEWVGKKVGDWMGLTGEKRDISSHIATVSDNIATPRVTVPDQLNNTKINTYSGSGISTQGNPHHIKIFPAKKYQPENVFTKYIAMCISPEDGPQRMPGIGFPTAMAHGSLVMPVYTDQNGNGHIQFFPYGLHCPWGGRRSPGSALYIKVPNSAYALWVPPDDSVAIGGAAGFSLNSGYYLLPDQSASASVDDPGLSLKGIKLQNGPLWPSRSVVEQVIVGPQSFKFVATVPTLEDQGMIECCQFKRAPNTTYTDEVMKGTNPTGTFTADRAFFWPRIPITQLRLQKSYKVSAINKNSTLRQCWVPDYEHTGSSFCQVESMGADGGQLDSLGGGEPFGTISRQQKFLDSCVVFTISGAKPNSLIGQILINWNAEFIPNGSAVPTCPVDEAEPGPKTGNFVTSMSEAFPELCNLDAKVAAEIAAKIMIELNSTVDYKTAFDFVAANTSAHGSGGTLMTDLGAMVTA